LLPQRQRELDEQTGLEELRLRQVVDEVTEAAVEGDDAEREDGADRDAPGRSSSSWASRPPSTPRMVIPSSGPAVNRVVLEPVSRRTSA